MYDMWLLVMCGGWNGVNCVLLLVVLILVFILMLGGMGNVCLVSLVVLMLMLGGVGNVCLVNLLLVVLYLLFVLGGEGCMMF